MRSQWLRAVSDLTQKQETAMVEPALMSDGGSEPHQLWMQISDELDRMMDDQLLEQDFRTIVITHQTHSKSVKGLMPIYLYMYLYVYI